MEIPDILDLFCMKYKLFFFLQIYLNGNREEVKALATIRICSDYFVPNGSFLLVTSAFLIDNEIQNLK